MQTADEEEAQGIKKWGDFISLGSGDKVANPPWGHYVKYLIILTNRLP